MAPDLNPAALGYQARAAYLRDPLFHQEVDLAAQIWWNGLQAHPPLKEYRNLGVGAIAVALWYEKQKRKADQLRVQQIAETWLRSCGACDGGLPMSCSCPPGDPRLVIQELIGMLGA